MLLPAITMRPSELEIFAAEAIAKRKPFLVSGAPGVGKSDIIGGAADSAEADIIISHPAVADPTDAKGFPFPHPDGTHATFLPFGELYRALDATRPTLWFLDDLGQALPATQASYMQLLLARRVNGHVLPDCVTFAAATNRRTDRAAVGGILEPVKSRFITVIELDTHIDDWCGWAIDAGMPPELIAFLRFRPDLLCNFEPSADLTNSPLPRTWRNAGDLLAFDIPEPIKAKALAGAVGAGAATEFEAFRRLYRELPSIDAILTDPAAAPIPDKPSTLYAITTALGMRVNVQTFGRLAIYAQRLVDAGRGDFGALLFRDCIRRDPAVASTPEGIRLMTSELGALMNG